MSINLVLINKSLKVDYLQLNFVNTRALMSRSCNQMGPHKTLNWQ